MPQNAYAEGLHLGKGWGWATPRVYPGEQGAHPRSQEGCSVESRCQAARVPQPLTHILVLEVESRLEVVDGGGARVDVLAQRGAAGDDAAGASRGCQRPPVPPEPAFAPRHSTHRS